MVCKKCGHIMGAQMKFCSRCGAVTNENESDSVSMDSVRSAFAPAEPVQTTPARPVGFQSLEGAPVYRVPMDHNNNNQATENKTASNDFISRPLPPTPVDVTKSNADDSSRYVFVEKKKSLMPVVLPIAGVAVLAVGLAAVFGSRSGEAADKAANAQNEWATGVGKNNTQSEDWSNDPTLYEEEAAPVANVQEKVVVRISDPFGPIEGADVALIGADGEVVRSVVSKRDGSATMTKVEAGTYTLTISKKGYSDMSESITLDESTMAYDLLLDREMEHLYTTLTIRTKSFIDDAEISDVNVNLYAARSDSEDPYISSKSDEYGICTLQNFPCGDFTIKCDLGNYSTLIKNIDLTQENNVYTVYLMPKPAQGEAYVVMDWNAEDLDLDLCAFNADLKEYVNTTHTSNANGSFLYEDHTGKAGVEAILLKDADSEAAQTFYVLDTTTAQSGSRSSKMGNSGVNVTIYKYGQEPQVFAMEDDTDALIWTVGTLQAGNFEKLNVNEYTTIITEHYWASDILGVKKPDPTPTMVGTEE